MDKAPRLRIWIDGELRLDELMGNADLEQLDRAVDDMETDCLAYGHRLLIVADHGPLACILARV
jgi:hypothetical protein